VLDTTEIEQAVTGLAGEPNGGVIAMPNRVIVSARFLIAQLASRYRLPTIGASR
jgi:hypothetical protein